MLQTVRLLNPTYNKLQKKRFILSHRPFLTLSIRDFTERKIEARFHGKVQDVLLKKLLNYILITNLMH